MAKDPSRDSSPDMSDRFASLTLEEREIKARKEIEALKLEERVAELEARRDTMRRRKEEHLGREGNGDEECVMADHGYYAAGSRSLT